jgi:hypothetical protein
MGFARGTLMSYCHGCAPGFLRNIRIKYHEQIARCMRENAINLPRFEDVHFVLDLGFASAPAGQTPPRLTFTGESPAMDRLQLSSTNFPTYDLRALAISTRGSYFPLPGFTLVPSPDLWWPAQSAGMPMDLPLPVGLANGLVLYFQEFFTVGPEIYSSNALSLEIIR